ncbi:MAG TPA: hypothetical protein VFL66_11030 [Gaiellaceae bacterium]|nr:hypothetical protein [Gaiellaceae bacterium]
MLRALLFELEDTLTRRDPEDGLALASTTHALLDALRDRGLALGLVAGDVEPAELAERFDTVAPAPAEALERLAVEPADALYVGASAAGLRTAGGLGLATVQAFWFRADDGGEPAHEAFTQMDVLNVADRLARPD